MSDNDLFGSASDSDSDDIGKKAKPAAAAPAPAAAQSTQDALFGSDSDSDSDAGKKPADTSAAPPVAKEVQNALFGSDTDDSDAEGAAPGAAPGAAAAGPAEVIRTELAHIPACLRPHQQEEILSSRLPNILAIRANAFEEDVYDPADDSFEKSYIRWRYKRDDKNEIVKDEAGQPVRESNTRLVTWEDGSVQMLIGTTSYDVVRSKVKPVSSSFLFCEQRAQIETEDGDKRTDTILEAHGEISSKMNFRPTSLTSDVHKALTLAVRKKHLKSVKILHHDAVANPDAEKQKRVVAADKVVRMNEIQNRKREREWQAGGGGDDGRRGMSREFLEEGDGENELSDDDDDDGNIGSIRESLGFKSKSKKVGARGGGGEVNREEAVCFVAGGRRSVSRCQSGPVDRSVVGRSVVCRWSVGRSSGR
jgi:RNA polymerase-associated protein LEO1